MPSRSSASPEAVNSRSSALHGLAGEEVGGDVGDVVAVVGRLGPAGVARLQALQARLHRAGQRGDLHAGVVVIELARAPASPGLEQVADRVAQRGLAPWPTCSGPVGLAETNSTITRWPLRRLAAEARRRRPAPRPPPPAWRPALRRRLMKPGPAISSACDPALHRGLARCSASTSACASSRGFFFSGLASCIAAVMARSPWAACLGDSKRRRRSALPGRELVRAPAPARASRSCLAWIIAAILRGGPDVRPRQCAAVMRAQFGRARGPAHDAKMRPAAPTA